MTIISHFSTFSTRCKKHRFLAVRFFYSLRALSCEALESHFCIFMHFAAFGEYCEYILQHTPLCTDWAAIP